MELKQRRELRKFVENLEKFRGRHTELVSVYVPAGYEMVKIIHHLQEEQGTASNIKDKRNRQNVIDSLERVIRHLRLFKQTPPNGLAVFGGNISDKESQVDIQVFSIEPPQPLNIRIYRCDQTFVVDILKNMLEHNELYGLIVIDRREGTLGLLKGTYISKIANFTSDVPGKTTKGGQCLNHNSIVQINDGCLEKIEKLHNPYIIKSVEFKSGNLIDSAVTDKWDTLKSTVKIITKTPRLEIECSPDHTFFVRSDKLEEKSADELKEGDYLLMPEKIDIGGKKQKLGFKNLRYLEEDFAQFLGYFLGDGNLDTNRIVFSEGSEEIVEYYKNLFDNLFSLDSKVRFRENKNYYELRIYSKDLFEFIKSEFPELRESLDSEIPRKILMSENKVVAGFLKGLFDAEGYVAPEELSIGMNNRHLIQQLQMVLLRFGIIGSFCEYDNRRNQYSDNVRYTLRITDHDSLVNFRNRVGFGSKQKNRKLSLLINQRTNISHVRQLFKTGKEIRKILEKFGYLKENFPKVSNFFYNQREMSKHVFKNSIMNEIKNNKELYNKLKKFLDYNLIPVKISKIEKIDEEVPMVDISVKNQSFIANCVLVHNSQQRYARLREEAAHNFFKKVGEAANKEFSGVEVLKGILVGGPGPTKEDFLEGDYLHARVKEKIIGVKDLSYTGEFGLNELVDKSHDVLSQESVIEEKKAMERFFNALSTKGGHKGIYKEEEIRVALERGAVDTLLLSETLDDKLIEELEKMAENIGAKVEMISVDTVEGRQLRDLGGLGAILRFNIN